MRLPPHIPMSPFPRFLLVAFACLAGVVPALAQTPRVYLKIDNTNPGVNPPLKDYSSAGIITSVTAAGFAPTYTTDRNGAANQALVVPGDASLQLIASSLPGNSNLALGLRNAGGTNTSFTLTGRAYFKSVSGQG